MDAETHVRRSKKALISDFLGELSNPRVKLATTVYASRFYRCIQSVTDSPINQILLGLNNQGAGDVHSMCPRTKVLRSARRPFR